MPRLQPPEVARQADREGAVPDRHQRARTFQARDVCDGLGQPRRLAGRLDAEHGGRAAMEHDPVVHAIRVEECPPALLAHATSVLLAQTVSAAIVPLGRRSQRRMAQVPAGNALRITVMCASSRRRLVLRVRDDQPLADGQRIPTAVPRDLGGETLLAVHRAEQLVDVGDGCLELDDEQRAGGLMPGEDVDDAALAVDREGHLRGEYPLGELVGEPPCDQLVQLGVPGVEQPIQVAGPPTGVDVDPDVERSGDAPDVVQAHRADVTALHPADPGLRHAAPSGPAPPATSPCGVEPTANGAPDPLIVHGRGVSASGRFICQLISHLVTP